MSTNKKKFSWGLFTLGIVSFLAGFLTAPRWLYSLVMMVLGIITVCLAIDESDDIKDQGKIENKEANMMERIDKQRQ